MKDNNFDNNNLHYFAMSFLGGKAGKFIDNIQPEPENWEDFVQKLTNKYEDKQPDEPTLYFEIITKKQ